MNPYVFFVGCARSGTTLVQRLADAHPQLAVMHGTRWIARWYEVRRGLTADGRISRRLIEAILEHPRFHALHLQPAELWRLYDADPNARYADLVSAIFERFGQLHGKPLVGDKTPEYTQSVATLHALWPAARFVHVIRDGRDVHLSVADWGKGAAHWSTWDDDPVATTATWWERNVRLAREVGAALGPELYHELRYESLVADSAGECARLCAFLRLPFEHSMLRFHKGRTRHEAGFDAKKAWLPVTPGLRNWRSEMPPDDLVRFESVAGDLLEELGYARAAARPSRTVRERAARIRQAYVSGALERDLPIPRAWETTR